MRYDIFIIGLGGQGVLTIGEIIAESASRCSIPVNLFPTKGMAQRGGAIRAQLRLGRELVGPNIPIGGATLVIALEISEALKAVRFAGPGADFLLYGSVWLPPTDVMSKELYPDLQRVLHHLRGSGSSVFYIDPKDLPQRDGSSAPGNIYILGLALGNTQLGHVLDPDIVASVLLDKWEDKSDINHFALQAGVNQVLDYEH